MKFSIREKDKLLIFCLYFLIISISCSGNGKIFNPVVAGSFYPSEKQQLEYQVKGYLASVTGIKVNGDVWGVIAPHAGYIYSAPVAAYSYRAFGNKDVGTVVVMAPSHRSRFSGIAMLDYDYYQIPGHRVKIDRHLVKKLAKHSPFFIDESPFKNEHSAEVQLPFIVQTFKGAKVVLALFGDWNWDIINKGANVISKVIKENNGRVVFVASSDLSHYHPYDIACTMDTQLLSDISELKVEQTFRNCVNRVLEMCGLAPVTAAMVIARELKLKPVVLNYKNSGDTVGSPERVVGYGSVAFVKSGTVDSSIPWKACKERKPYQPSGSWVDGKDLNISMKRELLKIARATLESYVKHRTVPEVNPSSSLLKKKGAVFVTLNKVIKKGNKRKKVLRGCIGGLSAVEPLYVAVQHMTVSSCSKDPRFYPVREDELKDIEIEISVLSPMKQVKDAMKEVKIGRDGLVIEYGGRRGVLLPQVPVEWGWDLKTYLKQICLKAGLPPGTWKKEGARLYRFTATVFSEEDLMHQKGKSK